MTTTTGAIVGRNAYIEIGTKDISGSSNMVSLSPEKDTAAFAVFGDDWEHTLATVKRWSGAVRAVYSEVTDEAVDELYAAYDAMTTVAIEFAPKGNTAGNWNFTGSVHITGAPVEVDRAGGVVVMEFPFTGDGTLTKGAISA